MTAKATAKKTARRKTRAEEYPEPAGQNIPKGMKKLGSSYAPTWKPEKAGDSIHGTVTSEVREVEFEPTAAEKRKGITEPKIRRVMEVTDADGKAFAVWESAALEELFGQVEPGSEVFIQYDGLGKKKAGQNPPKLFTVAIAA